MTPWYQQSRMGYGAGGWYDESQGNELDAYPGYASWTLRDHDRLLLDAVYAHWSRDDEQAYQYLADAYNKFARKDDEPIVLPPPSGI